MKKHLQRALKTSFIASLISKLSRFIPEYFKSERFNRLISRIKISNFFWALLNLPEFNFIAILRKKFIARYIAKNLSGDEKKFYIAWQPLLWVFLKITLVVLAAWKLYSFYPVLAGWMNDLLLFFRLHEIYNFKFPDQSFFMMISKYLFLFLIGYHGLYFLYFQLEAFFSCFAIDPVNRKAYYIQNTFIRRNIYIFTLPEIELIVLEQNLLFRILKIGTIVLHKKSGEQLRIASLHKAPEIIRQISIMKAAQEQ